MPVKWKLYSNIVIYFMYTNGNKFRLHHIHWLADIWKQVWSKWTIRFNLRTTHTNVDFIWFQLELSTFIKKMAKVQQMNETTQKSKKKNLILSSKITSEHHQNLFLRMIPIHTNNFLLLFFWWVFVFFYSVLHNSGVKSNNAIRSAMRCVEVIWI